MIALPVLSNPRSTFEEDQSAASIVPAVPAVKSIVLTPEIVTPAIRVSLPARFTAKSPEPVIVVAGRLVNVYVAAAPLPERFSVSTAAVILSNAVKPTEDIVATSVVAAVPVI